jgi:hypothetical protein
VGCVHREGTVTDLRAIFGLLLAHGHRDYPRFPDDGGTRTTNYNIAAVRAGLGNQAVSQK